MRGRHLSARGFGGGGDEVGVGLPASCQRRGFLLVGLLVMMRTLSPGVGGRDSLLVDLLEQMLLMLSPAGRPFRVQYVPGGLEFRHGGRCTIIPPTL